MTPAEFSSLFADAQRAGVYQLNRDQLEPLMTGAGEAGCLVQLVDLRRARNKDELLNIVGKAMRFPDWFGQNWDALQDCLLDMGWQPALGYVTILERCDMLRARSLEDFTTLVEIFQSAAAEWRAQGVPFWCLVELQTDNPFDAL